MGVGEAWKGSVDHRLSAGWEEALACKRGWSGELSNGSMRWQAHMRRPQAVEAYR